MSDERLEDRLMDVFLAEQVGGLTPPDISPEILARAFATPPPRAGSERPVRRVILQRWEVPAAVAATILIAFIIWTASLSRYPEPRASGDYSLAAGNRARRGATIRTEEGTALLELGGYCRVEIGPWTTLRINGGRYEEEVFIETGTAVCSVDPDVGKFAVRAELGTVSVRGTEFTVRVGASGGRKSMWVKVTTGSVEVAGAGAGVVLRAGQEWTASTEPPAATPGDGATEPPSEGAERGGHVGSEAHRHGARQGDETTGQAGSRAAGTGRTPGRPQRANGLSVRAAQSSFNLLHASKRSRIERDNPNAENDRNPADPGALECLRGRCAEGAARRHSALRAVRGAGGVYVVSARSFAGCQSYG